MSSAAQAQAVPAAQANESPKYIFGRGWKSSLRLNFNHFLMKEVGGYLVHPKIPTNNPSLRIADIGTGTGIWACELAQRLPKTVRIDGFDVSDAQYPAPGFRPENVHFYTHDGFKDYPAEFQGQYDIVHIRFFLCIVNDPEAKAFLQKLLQLVKPGGYLQWFEPLPRSTKVIQFQPGVDASNTERLAQTWHKPRPDSSYDWVEGMADLFKEEGMTDVVATRHDWPAWLRPLWSQSSLMSTEDVLPKVDIWHNESSSVAHPYMAGLEKEIAQGVAADTPFQCVVGRKPL